MGLIEEAKHLKTTPAYDEKALKAQFDEWVKDSRLEKHYDDFVEKRYNNLQIILMLTSTMAEDVAEDFGMRAGTKAKFTQALTKLNEDIQDEKIRVPRKYVRMQTDQMPPHFEWKEGEGDGHPDLSKEPLFLLDNEISYERVVR